MPELTLTTRTELSAPGRRRRRTPRQLTAGASRFKGGRDVWSTNEAMRHAEREIAVQAQRAYERTAKDWQQKTGASATPGRASDGSSKEQVARQTSRPKSAL
jgi:hypothetical protein